MQIKPSKQRGIVLQGVFRGLGDTKSPLWATIICNGVNVLLDAIFIMYFGWGVTGAAWATLIGQVGFAADSLLVSLMPDQNTQRFTQLHCNNSLLVLFCSVQASKQWCLLCSQLPSLIRLYSMFAAPGCSSYGVVCCAFQTLQHILSRQAGIAECCQISGPYRCGFITSFAYLCQHICTGSTWFLQMPAMHNQWALLSAVFCQVTSS